MTNITVDRDDLRNVLTALQDLCSEVGSELVSKIVGEERTQSVGNVALKSGLFAEISPFVELFASKAMSGGPGTNTGHGHVWRRPDGSRARCGGPHLCKECASDYARWGGEVAKADFEKWQSLHGEG